MKLSSKAKIKLSKRLQQIDSMVTSQYSHIWDCCCDHGLLGFALLSRHVTHNINNIHFVDIVPELMTELESKLQRYSPSSSDANRATWLTHCLDVAKLPLNEYEGNHLVIIAGVGGDLMIKFIEAIYQHHRNLDIDFLLCPVHHQFSLRKKLIDLDFSLKDEVLVEENRRFYEILLVSSASNADNKISPIGDEIWQSLSRFPLDQPTEIADKYLIKTIKHYQRILQGSQQEKKQVVGKSPPVQNIIDAYMALAL